MKILSVFAGTPYEGLFFANGAINSPGVILTNLFSNTFDLISEYVGIGLEKAGAQEWTIGLINDGVVGGIFAVLGFLPQILFLFLFFSILEDSGYMARVAFILDRIFRKFGVSGRAFMPMIMGFGCSLPAMNQYSYFKMMKKKELLLLELFLSSPAVLNCQY